MITTKQRAYLKSLATNMSASMQIGKEQIKEQSLKQIEEMLNKNELIKIKVLKTCDKTARDVANEIAKLTNSDIVLVIGFTVVLYRKSARTDIKHIDLRV